MTKTTLLWNKFWVKVERRISPYVMRELRRGAVLVLLFCASNLQRISDRLCSKVQEPGAVMPRDDVPRSTTRIADKDGRREREMAMANACDPDGGGNERQ